MARVDFYVLQRVDERAHAGLRRADLHDARELVREVRHAAAFPVSAMCGDDAGQGVHQAGTVVADDGQYEDGHDPAPMVAGRPGTVY